MRNILDSSVGLKWFFEEDGSDAARKLGNDYRNAVIELLHREHIWDQFTHAERMGLGALAANPCLRRFAVEAGWGLTPSRSEDVFLFG